MKYQYIKIGGGVLTAFSSVNNTQSTNNYGYSYRQMIPVGKSGVKIRFKFEAGSGGSLHFNNVSIGHQSSGANTTATPVELKFGGASGFYISANATIWSDWIYFPVTNGEILIVIMDAAFASPDAYAYYKYKLNTAANNAVYYRSSSASYNQSSVSGYMLEYSNIAIATMEVMTS